MENKKREWREIEFEYGYEGQLLWPPTSPRYAVKEKIKFIEYAAYEELKQRCEKLVEALKFYSEMRFNREKMEWMPGAPISTEGFLLTYGEDELVMNQLRKDSPKRQVARNMMNFMFEHRMKAICSKMRMENLLRYTNWELTS